MKETTTRKKQTTIKADTMSEIVKITDYYLQDLKIMPPRQYDLTDALIRLGIKKFWEDEEKRAAKKQKTKKTEEK